MARKQTEVTLYFEKQTVGPVRVERKLVKSE